jgi:hypothetical protein
MVCFHSWNLPNPILTPHSPALEMQDMFLAKLEHCHDGQAAIDQSYRIELA